MAKKAQSNQPGQLVNVTNVLDENTIKLYGYVGVWQDIDWAPFEQAFRPMDKPGNTITIRVNCYGGDVFAGLSIYDLVKNAQAEVVVINEGVAASMGGVFTQAASRGKRKATRHSRIMTHCVTGGCRGDAEDHRDFADTLETENENIIQLFVSTTGQPEKVVRGWFKRGVDKWFTAQQALEAGLIDEIIDGGSAIPANKLKNQSPEQIWNLYTEYTDSTNSSNMNKYQMAILAVLASAGISQTPAANATDEQWVEALNNAVNSLKTKVSETENKMKAVNSARAKSFVAGLKQSGKLSNELTPEQEAMIVEQATNNYDVIEALYGVVQPTTVKDTGANGNPVRTDINSLLNPGSGNPATKGGIPQDRADWDITKWAKEDPSGLQNLAKTHPKEYQSLLNAVESKLIDEGVKTMDA